MCVHGFRNGVRTAYAHWRHHPALPRQDQRAASYRSSHVEPLNQCSSASAARTLGISALYCQSDAFAKNCSKLARARALSPAYLAQVRLPMRGVKHLLRVATAGGRVKYELLRKFRLEREEYRSTAPGVFGERCRNGVPR